MSETFRGGRSRGGGRGRGRFQTGPPLRGLPTTSQVRPGASVSMVLKADQPTGRQVQGVVRDVLTSGDHPRGIKVRLVDGRVGRVQRMASEQEAAGTGDGESGSSQTAGLSGFRGGHGRGWGSRGGLGRDVREVDDGGMYRDGQDQGRSLEAYFPPEWRSRQGNADGQSEYQLQNPVEESGLAECPICHNFRGDGAAVTHHVNTHFD